MLCSQHCALAPRGSRTFSVLTCLHIQLDIWALVGRTEEGRSYVSMEDHPHLQSKVKNYRRQGLPTKLSSRAASHIAWLITPVAPAPWSGGKAAKRHYSSTDPLLQPHGQGEGPNLSLKRSPVEAEWTEKVLGIICGLFVLEKRWWRGGGPSGKDSKKKSSDIHRKSATSYRRKMKMWRYSAVTAAEYALIQYMQERSHWWTRLSQELDSTNLQETIA